MTHQYPPMNGLPEPKKKRSKWKWGCLGCLGLIVIGFVFLVILGVIGALVAPPSTSASTSAAASASPTAASPSPEETESASPTPSTSPTPSATPTETESASPAKSEPAEATQTAAAIGDSDAPEVSAALATLDTLEVKGRAPRTGYSRDQFGPAWEDVDRNGCSTRNDILDRDLTQVQKDPDGCKVKTGVLNDPYTGKTIDFVAGQGTSDDVQIDHVVALSDAWQKGAQQLSAADRLTFANDPLNLLAVDGPTNQAKGDGDAATWLPPNRSYWCPYTARQVEVKSKYHLWVTQAEHDRIKEILSDCPSAPEAEPTENGSEGENSRATEAPVKVNPAPPAPAKPEPVAPKPVAPQPVAPEVGVGGFPNCTAARAAGAAPLYAGSPGYSSKLDRDGDGVACE